MWGDVYTHLCSGCFDTLSLVIIEKLISSPSPPPLGTAGGGGGSLTFTKVTFPDLVTFSNSGGMTGGVGWAGMGGGGDKTQICQV